mgnify:CR=1 FL=1
MRFELLDRPRDQRAGITLYASSLEEAIAICEEHGEEGPTRILAWDCAEMGNISILPHLTSADWPTVWGCMRA